MIIDIMEWIGTISFAVSGALVAIGCSLDLFGVIIVGCVTAFGGGMLRDVLIGNIPPNIFSQPLIVAVAIVTSLIVFVIAYARRKEFGKIRERIETVNNFFDALGLAAFSIAGVEVACMSEHGNNVLLVVTLGTITGVGGGVLRDVLVNEKPYILTKHIYALVSIVGCCLYYALSIRLHVPLLGTGGVLVFTVVMRMLAATFHWKLPKIQVDNGG